MTFQCYLVLHCLPPNMRLIELLSAIIAICTIAHAQSDCTFELKKFATTEERIQRHGYPTESHFVETSDGYLLNVFRIPYSHKLNNKDVKKPVIFLQHGFFSNSDCWLTNGPDNSLAYLIADAGFDVWLGNARGNIYSRNNTQFTLNHPKFWQFSWHEIGTIDVATMIDYILEKTDESAIHYVGHSQGTTAFFVLMSERPEYNRKIKTAHMLAPCGFMGNGKSPVFKYFTALVGTPGGIWNSVFEDMELMPQNRLVNRLLDSFCGEHPYLGVERCRNTYLWIVGDSFQNVNQTAMQILLETHPGGSSSNQGIHYLQLYVSGEFRQYDRGTKGNQKLYQQSTPPQYDLSKITAPTYLYSAPNDGLCGPKDVDKLISKMPQIMEDHRVPVNSFGHIDFLIAKQLKELLNERIIKKCNEFEKMIQQ